MKWFGRKAGRDESRPALTRGGYRVREARRGRLRELLLLDLQEVSLVASPMQPLARVHAVEG